MLRCTLQAVHDAISRRIEWLDGNFLAAINAYVVAAEQQGNPQLQRVLATIRSEVLQQVRPVFQQGSCWYQHLLLVRNR